MFILPILLSAALNTAVHASPSDVRNLRLRDKKADSVILLWDENRKNENLNTIPIIAVNVNGSAPSTCDRNQSDLFFFGASDQVFLSGLTPDTRYAVRVCIEDTESGETSPGIAGTFTTPKAAIDLTGYDTDNMKKISFRINVNFDFTDFDGFRVRIFEHDKKGNATLVDSLLIPATSPSFTPKFPHRKRKYEILVDAAGLPRVTGMRVKLVSAGLFNKGHLDW